MLKRRENFIMHDIRDPKISNLNKMAIPKKAYLLGPGKFHVVVLVVVFLKSSGVVGTELSIRCVLGGDLTAYRDIALLGSTKERFTKGTVRRQVRRLVRGPRCAMQKK